MSSFIQKLAGSKKTKKIKVKDKKLKIKPAKEEEKKKPEKTSEGQLGVDLYQTDLRFILRATIAGVKPEDLDIAITNDMVTVRGKRHADDELTPDDYFYQECYWGPFSRSIILPVDVQTDKSLATLKNGVLTIRLPKSEKIKTKKIEIKHHEE